MFMVLVFVEATGSRQFEQEKKMNLVEHFFREAGWPALSENAHELLRASAKNDGQKVSALLGTGGDDIHIAVNDALSLSARRGYTDIVKLLLDAGADADALGGEALRWAREAGHTDTVKLLEDWMVNQKLSRPSHPPAQLARRRGPDRQS